MVRANSEQKVFLDRVIYRGYLRAHGFGNLHRMCADTATRAVDQYLFSGPDFGASHEMQRIQSAQRHGCGFCKAHIVGLGDNGVAVR